MSETITEAKHGVYRSTVVESVKNEGDETYTVTILRVLVRDGGEPGKSAREALTEAGYTEHHHLYMGEFFTQSAIRDLQKSGATGPVVVSAQVVTSVVDAPEEEQDA